MGNFSRSLKGKSFVSSVSMADKSALNLSSSTFCVFIDFNYIYFSPLFALRKTRKTKKSNKHLDESFNYVPCQTTHRAIICGASDFMFNYWWCCYRLEMLLDFHLLLRLEHWKSSRMKFHLSCMQFSEVYFWLSLVINVRVSVDNNQLPISHLTNL